MTYGTIRNPAGTRGPDRTDAEYYESQAALDHKEAERDRYEKHGAPTIEEVRETLKDRRGQCQERRRDGRRCRLQAGHDGNHKPERAA